MSNRSFTRLPAALIREKHARILAGEAPRTLDLFAGCGGISLGFDAAGFRSIAAVEFDEDAARSHALNFFRDLPVDKFELHAAAKDITKIEPDELLSRLGYAGSPDKHVDVLVGGPPCQAFARVGRAKLREVADHPEAFLQDPRGNLYLRYLHYVDVVKPIALLMENVPDVLNYGGHNIAEETCELLTEMGYTCRYTLLNSVFFGAPQMRERMFLIAIASEIAAEVQFPSPTHWIDLPKGYDGTRNVALQTVKRNLSDEDGFFVDPPKADKATCEPAVTARDAIGDLPVITDHLEGRLKKGARRFDALIPYSDAPLSKFAKLMRTWPGFENDTGIKDHLIRFLPRDYAIFARMNPGDQYPEAHQHAIELFRERLAALEAEKGKTFSAKTVTYKGLWDATVPPYDPGKFPNKWRKMEADAPARTLMAHLGKDGYSHIHFDSKQARTISVREAARLQSFPDGFILSGSMNPAFRQIGNAVPALLAKALADSMFNQLTKPHAAKASAKKAKVV
ncbi:DNA cytosine methyltransferase [Trinickia soli]|uniref:DNA (cytosine-5-)-methyltransferase n=1 Tax=Trinickia soli TaxID=380675 RepID=A0A2N7VW89_9BURK|nr:DNA cytosine methyltransferase [Trinickia soli]PMS21401.1 DNA cytosine methyltransferase [Trinickia soli]CAB3699550.1 Modification methylase BanI [Trinickia soli]